MSPDSTEDRSAATARRVLSLAVAGASARWARVHGYQWDCPDDQVHAEGVDTLGDRALWRVELRDIRAAIESIVKHPSTAVIAEGVADRELRAARRQLRTALSGARYGEPVDARTSDLLLQIAALGQVKYP